MSKKQAVVISLAMAALFCLGLLLSALFFAPEGKVKLSADYASERAIMTGGDSWREGKAGRIYTGETFEYTGS